MQDSAHLIYTALFLALVTYFVSNPVELQMHNSYLHATEMWESCLKLMFSQGLRVVTLEYISKGSLEGCFVSQFLLSVTPHLMRRMEERTK